MFVKENPDRKKKIVKEFAVRFIVKVYTFTERNSRQDIILQRQALADICKIDVLKDFAKFAGKHLYQILYLIKLQASSWQRYCKKNPGADAFL